MSGHRDHPGYRGPNFAKLFAEAGRDARRDYHNQNPQTIGCGWFMGRIVKGGPEVPAMIQRIDHEPGDSSNKLDTGSILVAAIGGKDADPLDVMIMWGRRDIDEAEYRYRVADLQWTQQWSPEEAHAQPRRRVDWRKIPPVF